MKLGGEKRRQVYFQPEPRTPENKKRA